METHLFAMQVVKPRDLLRARQRTRQVAGLLGFDPGRQALLAAEVFACLQHRRSRIRSVVFLAREGLLHIDIAGQRFTTRLPQSREQTFEDVAWMMREIDRRAPFRAMDEIQAQNREVLAVPRPAAEPIAATGLRISDNAA